MTLGSMNDLKCPMHGGNMYYDMRHRSYLCPVDTCTEKVTQREVLLSPEPKKSEPVISYRNPYYDGPEK